MRGQAHRASFLALVALLATAMMGAAYAMWFEDLQLEAKVSTGTLDATLVCNSLSVPDEAEAEAAADGTHAYNISVTAVNPGDTIQCALKITNTGTTAWHLEEEELVVLLPDNTSYAATCDGYPDKCVAGGAWPEPAAGNSKPLYVSVNDLRGCQVHAGESLNATLFIGVNEKATPDTTYEIELDFKVHQWNESEWDGCGDPRAVLPSPHGRVS